MDLRLKLRTEALNYKDMDNYRTEEILDMYDIIVDLDGSIVDESYELLTLYVEAVENKEAGSEEYLKLMRENQLERDIIKHNIDILNIVLYERQ
jgi:hypothetical protein